MFKVSDIIRTKNLRSSKKKGFTLLELIFAAVILAVALSVILLEFLSCSLLAEASRNLTSATMHAQYVMEDIKNKPFIVVRDNGNTQWDWDAARITTEELTPLRNESIDTGASGTDLLDITVNVNWDDRTGRHHAPGVSLETLIAQP